MFHSSKCIIDKQDLETVKLQDSDNLSLSLSSITRAISQTFKAHTAANTVGLYYWFSRKSKVICQSQSALMQITRLPGVLLRQQDN